MPAMQTTLQYSIRKKVGLSTSRHSIQPNLSSPSKLRHEKENSDKVRVSPGQFLDVSPSLVPSLGLGLSMKQYYKLGKGDSRNHNRPKPTISEEILNKCRPRPDPDELTTNIRLSESRTDGSPRLRPSQQSPREGCFAHPKPAHTWTCTKRQFHQNNEDTDEEQNHTSPPKQGRRIIMSPKTPSQLISRLHMNTPPSSGATATKPFMPKKLFQTGLTYQHVRQALHSTVPEQMTGREKQLSELHNFLQSHLETNTSATLYISGPPGTGKTACLSKTMLIQQFIDGYKMVYVNCTSMKSAMCIYRRITEELALKTSGKTAKDYLRSIEKYLAVHKKMILLVLDEIDQLDSRNQSVLYTIFEWPSKKESKLVLVGIANALDLTDRILPRLQARLELKPFLMHFPPYSKEQIVGILSGRLKELDASHVLTPVAIQLVAAKVASMSGDARRALDIARRAVEKASDRSLPLKPTTDHVLNTSSPKKSNVHSVDLKEVMSVLNTAYGASQTLDDECNESFPLQQKVLLCSLVLIATKGNTKDVTIGKLYSVYRRVCVKRKLPSVSQAELLSLCALVATRGIIRLQAAKEPRFYKVCLQWDEEEVGAVLKDKHLLEAILRDTSCLSQ